MRAFDFLGLKHGWYQVIKQLPTLWQCVKWADLTFSWFGKLHAFYAALFSQILRKKSVVVVSGGEVCRFSFGGGHAIVAYALSRLNAGSQDM